MPLVFRHGTAEVAFTAAVAAWLVFELVMRVRQHQREATQPDLAGLAEQVQRLTGEVQRLRGLLRQHGIEPENKTA